MSRGKKDGRQNERQKERVSIRKKKQERCFLFFFVFFVFLFFCFFFVFFCFFVFVLLTISHGFSLFNFS